MKKILLSIFSLLVLTLSFTNNTYAQDWTYITNTTGGIRGYTLQSGTNYQYYGNGTWQESWTIPSVIFGAVPSGYDRAYLNGVVFSANINGGDQNKKYNVLEVIARFEQPPTSSGLRQTFNTSIPAYMGYTLSDGTNGEVRCQVGGSDNLAQEWNCKLNTTNYQKVTAISIDWGAWKTIGSNPTTYYIAGIGFPSNPNSISLTTWRYKVTSSDDPLVEGQQTIINQNQQIIDAQNQTNQWLQDTTPPNVDTSSLGSSVGWMPAGPVDSILTLPLQLLQGIVNVFTNTNCTPLRVPVPYVNEDITLPCVSTLMDEIGFTPIWGIVGGIISAVIIWDTLKWLYKFVDDTLTFRENNTGIWGGL